MSQAPEIVLYHYAPMSVFSRRIVWYLNLRQLPFSECIQPAILPRPSLKAIGTSYRRIPVLSIGRDIYVDTRLILAKLEVLFPPSTAHPGLPSSPFFDTMLEYWAVEGLFMKVAALIPPDSPMLLDKRFTDDREEMTGRPWDAAAMDKARPEALQRVKEAFELLEHKLLADGRSWVAGQDGPGMSDIEAIWPFQWLRSFQTPLLRRHVSQSRYPKVFAWIDRYDGAVTAAARKAPQPARLGGHEVLKLVGQSAYKEVEATVDANDTSGLQKGDTVEVFPTDYGSNHKDRGPLVGLNVEEIVVERHTSDGVRVRVHAPRRGFRVRKVEAVL